MSEYYEVSKRLIYQIISHFKWNKCPPIPRPRGRKKNKIPESEIELVFVYHSVSHLGPVALLKFIIIDEGIQITYNRIYKMLLSNYLLNHNSKKQKQRKYRKYQRKHSMSLWHGDWKLFILENREYWLIAFIDDRTRLITCYGVYNNHNSVNTF